MITGDKKAKLTKLLNPLTGSVPISGAAIRYNVVTHTFTIPNARVGDVVSLGITPTLYNPNLLYYGYVSAPDTLTIVVRDLSADIHVYNGSVSYVITPVLA